MAVRRVRSAAARPTDLASLERALASSPGDVELQLAVAEALRAQGRVDRVAVGVRTLLAQRLTDEGHTTRLLRLMQVCMPPLPDDALLDDLRHLITLEHIDPQDGERACVCALRMHSRHATLFSNAVRQTWDLPGPAVFSHPLLLTLLEQTVITDVLLEQSLTRLRSHLLRADGGWQPWQWRFAAALAVQCFNNEYVWQVSDEELRLVEDRVRAASTPGAWQPLVIMAMYRPLAAHAPAWLDSVSPPAELITLLQRQWAEPSAEQVLGRAIPTAEPVDEVSTAVRAQYEESPYPRWLHLPRQTPRPLRQHLQSLLPHVQLAEVKDPRVLIAGCGTGRHALLVAQRIRGADVHAVDLSVASLAYAQRRALELGVAGVTFRQADILRLPFTEPFDVIESVGVLHHMKDPVEGWRALAQHLRPGGLMCIGLYSEQARLAVHSARRWLKERGHGTSPADVRNGRWDLLRNADEELVDQIVRSPDFFSLSGCRDLLFHVQEHVFTIPRIKEALGALGLRFLGFELDDPRALAEFTERFPDDGSRTELDNWESMERDWPWIFGGMYVLWCQKRGVKVTRPRRSSEP